MEELIKIIEILDYKLLYSKNGLYYYENGLYTIYVNHNFYSVYQENGNQIWYRVSDIELFKERFVKEIRSKKILKMLK